MSCKCQRCGQDYKVDVMIPDELWDEISGSRDMLCGTCIMILIEYIDEYKAFKLLRL